MPRAASAHLCHLVSKLSRRSRESMIRVSHLQADRPNHVPKMLRRVVVTHHDAVA